MPVADFDPAVRGLALAAVRARGAEVAVGVLPPGLAAEGARAALAGAVGVRQHAGVAANAAVVGVAVEVGDVVVDAPIAVVVAPVAHLGRRHAHVAAVEDHDSALARAVAGASLRQLAVARLAVHRRAAVGQPEPQRADVAAAGGDRERQQQRERGAHQRPPRRRRHRAGASSSSNSGAGLAPAAPTAQALPRAYSACSWQTALQSQVPVTENGSTRHSWHEGTDRREAGVRYARALGGSADGANRAGDGAAEVVALAGRGVAQPDSQTTPAQ